MPVVLETRGLNKHFGGIIAANEVSLAIEKGARHALIGPNGAGKTTVVNLLTGVLRPTAGQILLDGNDITDLPPHERVRLGVARTFQINQLFAALMFVSNMDALFMALAAGYAGLAGAVLAQTQAFASLEMFSIERSSDVLLILIIGGTGWLYGGLVGALIYRFLQDELSELTARYWQFWIGLILVAIVVIGRDRIGRWLAPATRFADEIARWRPRRGRVAPTREVS